MSNPARRLRAVIVDDEEHCIRTLAWELEASDPPCDLTETFTESDVALRELPALTFDILFLDIEMPRLNGFELLTRLHERMGTAPYVIFTTAYSEYAVKAFKYSAVDYLLKPVDRDELNKALERVPLPGLPERAQDPGLLKVLFDNIHEAANGRPMRLSLPTGDGWTLVSIGDIVRCRSDGSYTDVHLTGGEILTISRNLKQVEESLASASFYRVHNSHLINLTHVQRFIRQDGGTLVMSDGSEVTVSRSRKDEVLNLLR